MTFAAPEHEQARASDLDRAVGFFGSGADDGPAQPSARLAHALAVVEFPGVLELVASHASSALGRAHVRALTPHADARAIAAEHTRVEAMRTILGTENGWPASPIPDIGAALRRLRVEGAAWTGAELRAATIVLVSARLAQAALTDGALDSAVRTPLAALAEMMLRDVALEKGIDRIVSAEGTVRDDASPSLRKVRKELRGAEGELVRLLERLMARLDARHRVADASVTLRNGRHVIPVRRDGRGELGGIVHDTSASGGTLFVEPPAAIEAGNRIRELEVEEVRQCERLLLEATDRLRPHHAALVATLAALVNLDSLAARARYAQAFTCAPAVLSNDGAGFAIVNGRHPLLLAREGARTVPFDLLLEPGEHTLLVSGPNTGGKTVLLKSVALLSLMVQSGVPATVGAGSRVAVFDRVFADIGDEQSIAASLSTFSAHLRNLTEIVAEATPRSLVLVDELGSGTDPVEGAALGGAILEALTRRGTTTFATTHLGALKELAHEVDGLVNASLQFDAVLLAPTFRLVKGIPGRSYGLSIARRLGMPEEVLQRAERRLPQGERDVAALLEDLEGRKQTLESREQLVAQRDEAAVAREERAREREQQCRERERTLERDARQAARRFLLDAREDIEETIRALRAAGAEQLEAAAAAARRAAEQRAGAETTALEAIEAVARQEAKRTMELTAGGGPIVIGAAVALATLPGKAGRVVELRGADAVVAVGAVKLTVPFATLRGLGSVASAPREVAVPLLGNQPDVVAKHEVDVRGLRVDDVEDAVTRAVDDAVRADLRTIRIIHGKGTGALRERVAVLLADDRRVRAVRLGLWNEGGAGVTVVDLS